MLTVILLLSTVHSANLKVLDSLKSKILDSVDSFSINHINVFLTVKPSSSKKIEFTKLVSFRQYYGIKSSAKTAKSQGARREEQPLCLSPSTFSICPLWDDTASLSFPSDTKHYAHLFPTQHVGRKVETKMLMPKVLK